MEQKDYYEILGVEKEVNQKQIKDAYRRLALKYHPDRNKDNPAAAARMKEINESYAVLSDSEKRRRYDALRQAYGSSAYGQFRQTYSEQDIFRGSDIQQIFEELSRAFGFRGFDDVFRESYGPGYRTFEFRRPGAFGRIFVGGSRGGEGYPAGIPFGGHLGRLIKYGLKKKWGIELPETGKDLQDVITISPELARSGGKIRYSCRKNARELLVTIPANIRAGQQIRLKRMGESGKGGGAAGDLYIEVRVRNPILQKIRDFLVRLWSSSRGMGRR
ncbi:MAG: DnaJ domain-containing protein [Pseudomonadota bacterium]